ncbi:hypothetical protein PR003_g21754 [Phytophthora rubi]|uniref:Uncharacterized protein n=1 Tax=Phytophthora rubi TaxID=129364 RepID=A0A6A4DAL3_9STRA|nr:hypothetical protein PR002_g31931 [Phytophthora rubi]KAE9304421.1 hypothetical protein PR003_g21754 [Phytophthora rubi]
MMTEDAVDEVRRGLSRGDRVTHGDEMHHLRESIYEDQYASSTFGIGREPEDEVHGD